MVENYSAHELKAAHGLALYIVTQKHKILFDLGPDGTLFENAEKRKIDLREIDIVVISHGHSDHGGALRRFLQINKHAMIYIQERAFERHYTKMLFFKVNVGIDKKLKQHPQVVLLEGNYKIDDELEVFTVKPVTRYYSSANNSLYDEKGKDTFLHEQNMIIHGKKNILILGCGHQGIINILEVAKRYNPQICVGGYHLYNPITKKNVSDELLEGIAKELTKYPIQFYTCHCTGKESYRYLAKRVKNMNYLSCGERIELE